jgi:hypothetical protein
MPIGRHRGSGRPPMDLGWAAAQGPGEGAPLACGELPGPWARASTHVTEPLTSRPVCQTLARSDSHTVSLGSVTAQSGSVRGTKRHRALTAPRPPGRPRRPPVPSRRRVGYGRDPAPRLPFHVFSFYFSAFFDGGPAGRWRVDGGRVDPAVR